MPAPADDSASREAERYSLLQEIYTKAVDLPTEERSAFLGERCKGDEALRAEVDQLLGVSEMSGPAFLSESRIAESREALELLLAGAEGEQEDPAWIPDRVGPYRVLRRIAEGGMGVVYEAEQDSPRRRIALKVIHPLLVTPVRLRRFRQEAEVLGRLQHPGIAQIYEAGTYDLGRGPQPYIAMEFVEGEIITDYAQRLQLPMRSRLELIAAICDAVEHANQMGVIHRDLKPDNIMIDGRGQPKVLDFGIARASEGSTMLTTMVTEQGDLLGTIAYMAPEQLEGQVDEITPRSDVFGLGSVAFELLSGKAPHDLVGLPLTVAVQLAKDKDPDRLGALRPELKGEVETMVGKALEKSPSRRYTSPAKFAEDIRAFLENRPIRARPPSAAYRARKFIARHRALVLGTVSTFLAILIGLFATLRFASRAAENAAQVEAESARVRSELLRTTENYLERGEWWEALKLYARFGAEDRDWPTRFMGSAFPPALPPEQAGLDTYWIANDALAPVHRNLEVPSSQQIVYDALRGGIRSDSASFPRNLATSAVGTSFVELEAMDSGRRRDNSESVTTRRVPFPRSPRATVLDPNHGLMSFYDLDTGEQIGELGGLRISSCARVLIPFDEQRIYTIDSSHRLIAIDSSTFEVSETFDQIVSDNCTGGSLSSDGRFYAHAPLGRPLEIWNLETRELILEQELDLLPGGEHRVRFSPDGSKLYVTAIDAMALIMNVDRGLPDPGAFGTERDPRATLYAEHESYLYGLCISPDGRMAATSSVMEDHVRVWDVQTAETLAVLAKPKSALARPDFQSELIAFSPDGSRLLNTVRPGSGVPEVFAWDLLQGTEARRPMPAGSPSANHVIALDAFLLELGPAPAMRLGRTAFLPRQGRALAIQEPRFRVPPKGELWEEFIDRNEEHGMCISPDGDRVAVACARVVRIFDRTTKEILSVNQGKAYAVDWSPDGKWIAVAGADGRIRLIEGRTLEERLNFRAHQDYVFAVVWTPDSQRLISISGDKTARVWDARFEFERERDLASFEALLQGYRAQTESELLAEFDRAGDSESKGAIVRVLLERRR